MERRLRALKEVYYASKTHKVGEEFDAHDADARLLVGLEKAEHVQPVAKAKQEAPKPQTQQLQTREMKSEEPAKGPVEPMTSDALPQGSRPRRYLRRDMTSEGDSQ